MLHRLFACLLLCCATLAGAAPAPGERDVAYGDDPRQRVDLYLPDGPGPFPVVVMVHGGAWRIGDKDNRRVVENKVARWLPRGIAFVSVNYRMLPDTAPLDQARDVARALAFLQQHAAAYRLDAGQLALAGHSAGAHLIALLAARPDLVAEAGARPWAGSVLLDSGALDVPAIMSARHFPFYDRAFGADPAYWQAVSPQQQLRRASAPLLAVCSSQRREACPQAAAFVAQARRLGGRAEMLAQDKSHGEINADLGDDPAYTAAVEAFLATLAPGFAERLGNGH